MSSLLLMSCLGLYGSSCHLYRFSLLYHWE